ncbi:MAG TPA: MFS transporter [Lacipirellulaceae bacterium]|jgi:ACS family tartrate transporter-like MFS transporter|nr:MFS transporter [Lacipirellulaceae bacterium]
MQNRGANDRGSWLEESLMRVIWLGWPANSVGERARRRVWVHLLPVLFLLYILAYIDRSNIAIAKFGMNRSLAEGGLGFDERIVGFGSGIFFWGYWVLEIPSTLSVERRGARWVFLRILILWGLCAVLMGFMGLPLLETLLGWLPKISELSGWPTINAVTRHWNGLGTNAESQFYFLRFMLGFFEGGFFPTVVMYLSTWFNAQHRAKAMASFMAAMPLSNVFGTTISQWISDHIHWGGLPGWRWIFILEGVAPILAGICVLFCLPDRPKAVDWLPQEEKDWLLKELETEARNRSAQSHSAWHLHLGLVLLLTLVYFCQNVVAYGMSTFMPSIVKSQFGGTELEAAWVTAGFFLIAFIAMQFNGWHSDRRRERIWHVAVPLIMLGSGLAIVSYYPYAPRLGTIALFLLVGGSIYTVMPAFWPIPTIFLGSTFAASAIGFINMIGNLGGSVGPVIIGDAAKNNDFVTGLWRIAIFPFIGAATILLVGYAQRRRGSKDQSAAR